MATIKQKELCVDLTRIMQERDIQEGEVRVGTLEVNEAHEAYTFRELPRTKMNRNPRVFTGQVCNVTVDRHGRYKVHMHLIVLSKRTSISRLTGMLYDDLSNAKEVLGL